MKIIHFGEFFISRAIFPLRPYVILRLIAIEIKYVRSNEVLFNLILN